MNNTIKLQQLSFEISDLLDGYVSIHNKLLNKAGTFRSLFKKVDFQELYDDAKTIYVRFSAKQRELLVIKAELYEDLNLGQKLYFDCLQRYFEALTKTVDLFFNNFNLLYERSQNKNNLHLKEFLFAQEQYQKSIEEYLKIGLELTERYKKL